MTICPKCKMVIIPELHPHVCPLGSNVRAMPERRQDPCDMFRNHEEVEREIAAVLNKHSIDSQMNVPDFILAQYLVAVLDDLKFMNHTKTEWEKQ